MFPENTGIRLNGDQPLIIQVHYNTLANDPTPDRTEIDLRLADTVDTEASMALLANLGLSLPPRMAEVETHHEGTILFGPTGPLRVWGAFPHMHTLGRQLRVEAIRDTGNQCMIDVPRWDFNWQSGYFYQTPIDLDAGQLLSLDCTYDTTERDEVTSWGDGTADEMCLSFFYVTPR